MVTRFYIHGFFYDFPVLYTIKEITLRTSLRPRVAIALAVAQGFSPDVISSPFIRWCEIASFLAMTSYVKCSLTLIFLCLLSTALLPIPYLRLRGEKSPAEYSPVIRKFVKNL
ncbi:MAG: hypothetical protein JWP12_1086 [Bacteroidetes bacterium]|nr:hypothetical protein [Bacteroidota bacterium]